MAGDWIKVEVCLPDKPEVWQIAGIVGIDPDAVVGKLLKVWRWFDTHTQDGNAPGVTYALVDSVSGVSGFGEAMAFCGWLAQSDRTLSLPNFGRHNGKTAKNRALTAKRVAKHKEESNAEGNDASVSSALPREEKRREEEKQKPLSPAPTASTVPHQQIVALYHELLPDNPRVKAWTKKRQSMLTARWRDDKKRQGLEYWQRFFATVSASAFLTGRVTGRDCRPFLPSLEWMLNETNFTKIIEGSFHDQQRQAA